MQFFQATLEVFQSGQVDLVPGEYVTIGEIICHLPFPGDIDEKAIAIEYDLSITNDGRTFSNPISVAVHDSTCVKKHDTRNNYQFQVNTVLANDFI